MRRSQLESEQVRVAPRLEDLRLPKGPQLSLDRRFRASLGQFLRHAEAFHANTQDRHLRTHRVILVGAALVAAPRATTRVAPTVRR